MGVVNGAGPCPSGDKWLAACVLLSLGAGVSIYLIDRPPEAAYFVSRSPIPISLHGAIPAVFGQAGFFLPSFFHTLAFSIVTGAIIDAGNKGVFFSCLFWFLLGSLFETGQMYGERIVPMIPDFFAHIPFLENSANYVTRGTFDYLDIIASALGAIMAYGVMKIKGYEKRSER